MTALAVSPDAIRDEMREKIRAIAAMCPGGHGIKAGLAWAARKARISPAEAKRLAYSEINIVPAHIADAVRSAARDVQIENDLAAARRLLAQIEEDDMHAAADRLVVAKLVAVATAPDHRGPGPGQG